MGLVTMGKRWPSRTIPYRIGSGVSQTLREKIEQAFEILKAASPFDFKWRDDEDAYILFRNLKEGHISNSSETGCECRIIGPSRQEINLRADSNEWTVVHEICHALGMYHEHQRLDRDKYVKVFEERIEPGELDQYAIRPMGMPVGQYDVDSIMHYSSDANGKPIRYNLPGSGYTSACYYRAGERGFLLTMRAAGGYVRVNEITEGPRIGALTDSRKWTPGWTTVETFEVPYQGGTAGPFLFLLKKSTGLVHIHRLLGDGTIGARTFRDEWSTGWTTASFYTIAGATYLFLLKGGQGTVHIHQMNYDGTVGALVETQAWTPGWTLALPYAAPGGAPGAGAAFLFLLKEESGTVHCHALNTDGSIGVPVDTRDWSAGWTSGFGYWGGGDSRLLLMKRSSGRLVIHAVRADGSIGALTDQRNWSKGHNITAFLGSGLLVMKTSGTAHVHKLYFSGEIDSELTMTPTMLLRDGGIIGKHEALSPTDIETLQILDPGG